MLSSNLLTEYAERFVGFGSSEAKIWFIGIEEAGGHSEEQVQSRLDAWIGHNKPEFADAPSFYPASEQREWHGENAQPQATWTKLIRLLLVARGRLVTSEALLEYQQRRWGKTGGREFLAELFPLPTPNTMAWPYRDWSELAWLESRARYQNHWMLSRALLLQQKIEQHHPKVVIFYASTMHRVWAMIARAEWSQAIKGKLMSFDRDGISFYVTRHPRAESDRYFQQIGEFLRGKHGN